MKKLVCSVFAVASAVAVSAEEVFIGYRGSESVFVEENASLEQSGFVNIEDEGLLNKTGLGAWTIPFAEFAYSQNINLSVHSGTLKLTDGEGSSFAGPAELLNKAAFWVSANHLHATLTNDIYVSRWLDRREAADVQTSTVYPYAWPAWDAKRANNALYGAPPKFEVKDGFNAVYFGGYGNPQSMRWKKPDGSDLNLNKIRHVFFVTTVTKQLGFLIGTDTHPSYFHVDMNGHTYWTSFDNDCPAIARGARTYLNGSVIDGRAEKQKKERQLVDVACADDSGARAFFNDRNNEGRCGGDYLHEFIVFTNSLTEAEAKRIRDYLMDTWALERSGGVQAYEIAKGAGLEVPIESGIADMPKVKGYGVFVRKNSGTNVYSRIRAQLCEDEIRLADGGSSDTKTFIRTPLSLALEAGDKISTGYVREGYSLERTGGAADSTVEQSGSGLVSIYGVPENVKNYNVSGGALRLAVHREVTEPFVMRDTVQSEIPNPSFEIGAGNITHTPLSSSHGWNAAKNDDGGVWDEMAGSDGQPDRKVFLFNRKNCDSGNQWPCSSDSPDGDVSLAIKGDCSAWTSVKVPAAGEYILSFKAAARNEYHNQNKIEVLFDDEVLGVVWLNWGTYLEHQYRVRVEEAGEYTLMLRAKNLQIDGCTLFDDFRMKYNADLSGVYRIPNGGFEALENMVMPFANFREENSCYFWTFDQTSVAGTGKPAVTPVKRGVSVVSGDSYPLITRDDFPDGGDYMLMFASTNSSSIERHGVATTAEFTPPPGTYKLAVDGKQQRGFTKLWGQIRSGANVLDAKLVVNGIVNELGSITITNYKTKELTWDKIFTINEGDKVSLVLEHMNKESLIAVDNVRFINVAGGNLVKNGSFEESAAEQSPASWTLIQNKENDTGISAEKSASRAVVFTAKNDFYTTHFVCEEGDGPQFLLFCQVGCATQEIDFPKDGLYELKFLASCRKKGPNGDTPNSGRNPIKAWIVESGSSVTNVIGWTPVENTNYVQHAFLFSAKKGRHTFGIQGMNTYSIEGQGDRSSMVDDISIIPADNAMDAPALHKYLTLSLKDDARLILDYPGTQEVYSVKVNGIGLAGEITAQSHPNVEGIGTLIVKPRGTMIIIR